MVVLDMSKVEVVLCKGCGGEGNLCMDKVKEVISRGGVAYMLYAATAEKAAEDLGFAVTVQIRGTIKIGMYIYKEADWTVENLSMARGYDNRRN